MALQQLMLGVPFKLFDADAQAAPVTSAAVDIPVPGKAKTIQFMNFYVSAPSAVTLTFQASLDGVNWFLLTTSTQTAGDMINVPGIAPLKVRCQKTSQTGGGALTTIMLVALY